jgi:hypothetical protein
MRKTTQVKKKMRHLLAVDFQFGAFRSLSPPRVDLEHVTPTAVSIILPEDG